MYLPLWFVGLIVLVMIIISYSNSALRRKTTQVKKIKDGEDAMKIIDSVWNQPYVQGYILLRLKEDGLVKK